VTSWWGRSRVATQLLVDDLIAAGTTLMRAVQACRKAGATQVDAFATHGVLLPEAQQLLGPGVPIAWS